MYWKSFPKIPWPTCLIIHPTYKLKEQWREKRFALSYANIFKADWKQDGLSNCTIKPLIFLKYLDDIWVWYHSEERFTQFFFNALNTHNSSIKFKVEKHNQSIQFLDTVVFKHPQFIHTKQLDIKVFFKPIDTYGLFHKSSFHQAHTFKAVKAQLTRFQQICTTEEDFWSATKILFLTFRQTLKPFSENV